MRSFAGLPLPDAARIALERVQEELTAGRPVPAENMHLTLAFLDDQPEQMLQALHQELAAIRAPVLTLRIQGLETFGGRQPRVLAAAVQKTPELSRLRNQVRSACQAAGIALARERFRPHVTLARFPRYLQPGQLEKIAGFLQAAAGFRLQTDMDCFALYQSTLAPDGARYDVLAEYPLES
ncbi:RNA 2',3'-cyclic phosphodiesterase [Leisingera sp. HS039]|uniref:RNA 2',3'-cyclic phosphodiesterase n=1 Tax=unclassified Leisingera TaxID=2614906 RepID=UPI0010709634|nr:MULTISPECIES: RNA 2',3'-cyclic phosphodiesterase [unclassified Leisingera]MBQ4825365.1 RNA 2',3'-cyclic phosphodiesterase [Leisingera sp. HS039]QBR35501.1 RNA 2',3'-cyclic phosphodiesterase [Leisingera sp. NJS201]